MDLVSVIVPTYNRFTYVLNAIASIQRQTYPHIEIIVVNDGSTDPRYYTHHWAGVTILHLQDNTKKTLGFACAAYVRNQGIQQSRGTYVAFCDDDDVWLPAKIQLQLDAMQRTGCLMSSTDGFIGQGVYRPDATYARYNAEHCLPTIQRIYRQKGSPLMDQGFPEQWDLPFLTVHNCMICSSVVMHRRILDTIGRFRHMRPPGEDWDCWLRALHHTQSVYVTEPCFYYDEGHGDGQNW